VNLTITQLSARHPASKASAQPALRTVSISIGSGEQVAVIGPSGSGKTTLLHVLACALKPASGSISIDGSDPWSLSQTTLQALRGKLFLAPQVPPLPPRQRVITSVLAGKLPQQTLFSSLKSLFYPTDIALADSALANFDLSDKLFDRVDRLSGGERQRVGLARLVASQANLLLVDEPLSALDPTRSTQAITTLIQTARARQATLVTTLHQVDAALNNFPRIIALRDGVVAFDLPAKEVTKGLLHELYANKLEELTGPAPLPIEALVSPEPIRPQMQCR
jgi:phosphonate transport system ATP-binding protein